MPRGAGGRAGERATGCASGRGGGSGRAGVWTRERRGARAGGWLVWVRESSGVGAHAGGRAGWGEKRVGGPGYKWASGWAGVLTGGRNGAGGNRASAQASRRVGGQSERATPVPSLQRRAVFRLKGHPACSLRASLQPLDPASSGRTARRRATGGGAGFGRASGRAGGQGGCGERAIGHARERVCRRAGRGMRASGWA